MRKTWGVATIRHHALITSGYRTIQEIEQSFYSLEEAEEYARKQAALNSGKKYTVIQYIEQFEYPVPGPVIPKFDEEQTTMKQ